MEPCVDPREWGRRQAAISPTWSEDKWRRVADVLGMQLGPPPATDHSEAEDDQHTEAA